VDGKEEKQYDAVSDPLFSPDSKRMAYWVNVSNKQFMVVDGKEEKQYDDIGYAVFSPDSKRVAYVAVLGKWFIVVDGKKGKSHDNIRVPVFSPDSKRMIYRAILGNTEFIIVDKKEGMRYNQIVSRVEFDSPDSFHYLASKRNSIYLIEERLK